MDQAKGAARARILDLELSRLQPNPHQPRKTFEDGALRELAESIAARGLIQPIAVIDNGSYVIAAGERRYRAFKQLGRQTIPAVVLKEGAADELALIENVQRQDLHPLEEAEAMKGLMERHGYTQQELGKVLGKARPTVTNMLKLNSLPEQIKEECSTSNIAGKSLLLEIARLPAEQQLPFWKVVKFGTTVRAARARKKDRPDRTRPPAELALAAGRRFLNRLDDLAQADGALDRGQLKRLTDLHDAIAFLFSELEDQRTDPRSARNLLRIAAD